MQNWTLILVFISDSLFFSKFVSICGVLKLHEVRELRKV